ncbi:TIGR01777 family oxidoreductase [Bdellovibrio bacteriovorus]|uniref:TIGR01777 family oxidoreductase n=1 Tax=Bdellovibrio bacteriovorus TaxID=959 RepID=UPI0021D0863C|nr:TIGR01777 family oxidoreductase [Bdellovibrio bacteriovorus]UXR63363.1 TIGR01777 family oxidoreductase [Bdellovibrio bacteriovorus]
MRILITGATGLIGRELGKNLAEKGHDLFVVSRNGKKAKEILPFPCEVIEGDLSQGPLSDSRLGKIEAAINLMGEPIADSRWTEEKKRKIYDSRVIATRNLVQCLPKSLKVLVSASAIGFYGDSGAEVLTEDGVAGQDFLAKLCKDWEAAAARAPGRSVFVRTGMILARQGGALDQMLFPFRSGIGGVLGTGEQWMSWIHIKDIVGLYLLALENPQAHGPMNGVAPFPVTNRDFSEALAQAVGSHLGPPVPMFALNLLFGDLASSLVASNRGCADKSREWGYKFHYPELQEALNDVCAPFQRGEEFFVAEQFIPVTPEKLLPLFKGAHHLEKVMPPTLGFKLKKWTHTPEFRPFCGGTLLVDRVRYKMPMGYLGWLVASRFVRKDVENIFSFRRKNIAAESFRRLF